MCLGSRTTCSPTTSPCSSPTSSTAGLRRPHLRDGPPSASSPPHAPPCSPSSPPPPFSPSPTALDWCTVCALGSEWALVVPDPTRSRIPLTAGARLTGISPLIFTGYEQRPGSVSVIQPSIHPSIHPSIQSSFARRISPAFFTHRLTPTALLRPDIYPHTSPRQLLACMVIPHGNP